jgi:hypothetical protein
MFFRKTVASLVICAFFLSSCVTNNDSGNSLKVGPSFSSSFFKTEADDQSVAKPKLDVIIPVFDPGLPEKTEDYEKEGIWPELRRAESTRFAYKLKEALDKTEQFGAVRVTPDKNATGDLYVLGKIKKSNGQDVEMALNVVDISGKEWIDDSFSHEVPDIFHNDLRNKGKDPYDPMFDEAAQKIVDQLKYHGAKDLEDIQYLTNLRFGANFSEEAFMQHMKLEGDEVKLVSKFNENDPMYRRIQAIRTRDQLFVDGLQANYAQFSETMNESYLMWQEQSQLEMKAEHEAKMKAAGQTAGAVALFGLAILSAVAGVRSKTSGSTTAGVAGAAIGGMVGMDLLQKSFKTSDEAKVHRDALNELGQSLDMKLAPQVIEFEKQTVKLTGDAKEQFAQWREFLKKIYEQEATPNVQL